MGGWVGEWVGGRGTLGVGGERAGGFGGAGGGEEGGEVVDFDIGAGTRDLFWVGGWVGGWVGVRGRCFWVGCVLGEGEKRSCRVDWGWVGGWVGESLP